MANPDPPSPQGKVTRLPTELTHLFERTLASHDAAETLAEPEQRADWHKQGATTVHTDGTATDVAATPALDLRRAEPVGNSASSMGARSLPEDPLAHQLLNKMRGEILGAAIGIGLLLVGIAVFVAIALLPHKPGMWLFIAAAVVLMLAGGHRIDAATRAHRRTKHTKSRRVQ